jgi:hypothetical protein
MLNNKNYWIGLYCIVQLLFIASGYNSNAQTNQIQFVNNNGDISKNWNENVFAFNKTIYATYNSNSVISYDCGVNWQIKDLNLFINDIRLSNDSIAYYNKKSFLYRLNLRTGKQSIIHVHNLELQFKILASSEDFPIANVAFISSTGKLTYKNNDDTIHIFYTDNLYQWNKSKTSFIYNNSDILNFNYDIYGNLDSNGNGFLYLLDIDGAIIIKPIQSYEFPSEVYNIKEYLVYYGSYIENNVTTILLTNKSGTIHYIYQLTKNEFRLIDKYPFDSIKWHKVSDFYSASTNFGFTFHMLNLK